VMFDCFGFFSVIGMFGNDEICDEGYRRRLQNFCD
jgi:hypothetical protein